MHQRTRHGIFIVGGSCCLPAASTGGFLLSRHAWYTQQAVCVASTGIHGCRWQLTVADVAAVHLRRYTFGFGGPAGYTMGEAGRMQPLVHSPVHPTASTAAARQPHQPLQPHQHQSAVAMQPPFSHSSRHLPLCCVCSLLEQLAGLTSTAGLWLCCLCLIMPLWCAVCMCLSVCAGVMSLCCRLRCGLLPGCV